MEEEGEKLCCFFFDGKRGKISVYLSSQKGGAFKRWREKKEKGDDFIKLFVTQQKVEKKKQSFLGKNTTINRGIETKKKRRGGRKAVYANLLFSLRLLANRTQLVSLWTKFHKISKGTTWFFFHSLPPYSTEGHKEGMDRHSYNSHSHKFSEVAPFFLSLSVFFLATEKVAGFPLMHKFTKF